MKTITYTDARKKGFETYDFQLCDGTAMVAYYENTPVERGDGRTTPDYGGYVTVYHITREKDNKVFSSEVLRRYDGFNLEFLEEEIGENVYGY